MGAEHKYGHKDSGAADDPLYLTFVWSELMHGADELPQDLAELANDLDLLEQIRFVPGTGYHIARSDLEEEPMLDTLLRYMKEYFIYNPATQFFYVREDWNSDGGQS